mgnify:CR=1 FL=1
MSPLPVSTPSYLQPAQHGPWDIYLQQVERVRPHLGELERWVETLRRPKRALIVDVPIQLDNGTELDLSKVTHTDLEAMIKDIGELTVDVDGDAQVRIRCE